MILLRLSPLLLTQKILLQIGLIIITLGFKVVNTKNKIHFLF